MNATKRQRELLERIRQAARLHAGAYEMYLAGIDAIKGDRERAVMILAGRVYGPASAWDALHELTYPETQDADPWLDGETERQDEEATR